MPEMFYRKWNDSYYVQIGKRQFNLGHDEKAATLKYAKLISQHRPPALDGPVAVLIARLLDWCKINRSKNTHKFYKEILDGFKGSIGNRLTRLPRLLSKLRMRYLQDGTAARALAAGAAPAARSSPESNKS